MARLCPARVRVTRLVRSHRAPVSPIESFSILPSASTSTVSFTTFHLSPFPLSTSTNNIRNVLPYLVHCPRSQQIVLYSYRRLIVHSYQHVKRYDQSGVGELSSKCGCVKPRSLDGALFLDILSDVTIEAMNGLCWLMTLAG